MKYIIYSKTCRAVDNQMLYHPLLPLSLAYTKKYRFKCLYLQKYLSRDIVPFGKSFFNPVHALLGQGMGTDFLWFIDANLKVHKIENFFGSEFEFYTISLLVMLKY